MLACCCIISDKTTAYVNVKRADACFNVAWQPTTYNDVYSLCRCAAAPSKGLISLWDSDGEADGFPVKQDSTDVVITTKDE